MNNILFSILLCYSSLLCYGQACYQFAENYINFEDTVDYSCLSIDTIHFPENVWSIGAPQKTLFTSGFNSSNAIVTDLNMSYPSNDTSVFTIKVLNGMGFEFHHTVALSGRYFVNSDTITDFGKIDFSPDNGNTWIDLLNDTIYIPETSNTWYWYGRPTLSGNSNGWQFFHIDIAELSYVLNITDTVLYRFSFFSDSIQTNKDGLMFDNLRFLDYVEGVKQIQNTGLISIYPNPVSDKLEIRKGNQNEISTVQILNNYGQIVGEYIDKYNETIDIQSLTNGIYFLRYSDNEITSIIKFVINH